MSPQKVVLSKAATIVLPGLFYVLASAGDFLGVEQNKNLPSETAAESNINPADSPKKSVTEEQPQTGEVLEDVHEDLQVINKQEVNGPQVKEATSDNSEPSNDTEDSNVLMASSDDSAEAVCDFLRHPPFDQTREGEDVPFRYKNCMLIFAKKWIYHREALVFTLKFFKENFGRLKDPRCVLEPRGQAGEENMSLSVLTAGIKNSCQFLLNDLTSKVEKYPFRADAFYVNLCAQSPKKVVKYLYVNLGVGTFKTKFADIPEKYTSVPGAFLTSDQTYSFTPYRWSSQYLEILDINGSKSIVGLRLFGLNSSNNDTSYSKPLHQSLYKSSFGCPSMAPTNAYIMKELAQNGPSLVMNYGPKSFHKDVFNCCNSKGSAEYPEKKCE